MKFAFWRRLPWILAGLAHDCNDTAVSCAKHALELFEQGLDAGKDHWISIALCTPGSHGRRELDLFISGCPLLELSYLARMAGRFRFVLISERWVESLHALNNKYLGYGPNTGVLHLVFHNVLLPLQRALDNDPNVFLRLAHHASFARNAPSAAAYLGFWNHPAMKKIVSRYQAKNRNSSIDRQNHGNVVRILYHTDCETLFRTLPPVTDSSGGGPPPGGPGGEYVRAGNVEDELWGKHAVQMLRDAGVNGDGGGDEVVVSIPLSRPGASKDKNIFPKLSAIVDPQPASSAAMISDKAQQPSLAFHGFDFQCEDPTTSSKFEPVARSDVAEEDGNQPDGNVMLFSVQRANPGRAKLAPGARRVADNSLLLSPLSVLTERRDGDGSLSFTVALEGDDGKAREESVVATGAMFSVEDMSSIKRWRVSSGLKYMFPNLLLPSELHKPLQSLMITMFQGMAQPTPVMSKAQDVHVPASSDPDGSKRRCLDVLESHGFVGKMGSSDELKTRWFLTQKGRSLVTVGFDIHSPRAVFAPSPNANVTDMNVLELHHKLLSEGWSLEEKMTSKDQEKILHDVQGLAKREAVLQLQAWNNPYKIGQPKIFWISPSAKTFCVPYMQALLLASVHGKEVPHLQPVQFYTALLAGKEYKGPQQRMPRGGFLFGAETHPQATSRKAKRADKNVRSANPDQEDPPSDGLSENDQEADEVDGNDDSGSDNLEDIVGDDTEADDDKDDASAQPRSQHIMSQQQFHKSNTLTNAKQINTKYMQGIMILPVCLAMRNLACR